MLGTPLGRILLDRPAWTYLLGPFFTARTPDAAAPLSATYREAGAVGALTVTQVDGTLATSGGALVQTAQGTPAWGDLGVRSAASVSRLAGRALLVTVTPSGAGAGPFVAFCNGSGISYANIVDGLAVYFNASGLLSLLSSTGAGATIGAWSSAVTYDVAVIPSTTGAKLLIRGGAFATWTVLYVLNAGATAALVAMLANYSNAASYRSFRVADLGGAWASDYGIATDRKATSAATDTITHTANCLVEHTITAATGVTQDLWVRRTDASNGWIVRMDQAGSTIKLIELVAGVETERASTAQTWTNATQYRVVVICDGTTITPYVANVAKTGYASASTNQSATTAYVDTAGSELIAWPRTVALPQGV